MEKQKQILLDHIIVAVCSALGLERNTLEGQSGHAVIARGLVVYFAQVLHGFSLRALSQPLCKNAATLSRCARRAISFSKTDQYWQKIFKQVQRLLVQQTE